MQVQPSPPTEIPVVDEVSPANDGVLVIPHYLGDDAAHCLGTVLLVGRGVPWLNRGSVVTYPGNRATTICVRPASLDLTGIKHLVRHDENGDPEVYTDLVSQRDIQAVLFDHGIERPDLAARPA